MKMEIKTKELICIVCPKGCHLQVDGDIVNGNQCARGVSYAKDEISNPRRTLTSTVKIKNSSYPRCPVKTLQPIPKKLIFQAMYELNRIEIKSPVYIGQVIIDNICGSGVALVVTKNM